MIQDFSLGEWLPDLADYKNPGVVVCDGCYPSSGGYSPFLGPVSTSVSVTGEVRGARRFERYDGTAVSVVGTDSDLFIVVGSTVTASGLGLSLAAGVIWQFEQFNKQVWAFAYGQTPQYLTDIDTDTTFSAHPGTAPKAASVGRVGDFIVTANMQDIDASVQPYRVRWSQFNNPAGDYGTDLITQSGYHDFPQRFGPVIGVFGGRNDVVLQKYAVHRLTYTGGATAFRRDVIEEERGCAALGSAVTVGTRTYFLANDGFCRTDGASVEVISTNRVFEWFLSQTDLIGREGVRSSINWNERCVIWSFIPRNKTARCQHLIYSWVHDRWSTAEVEVDWLFTSSATGLTLEEVSAANPDLDAMTISLDSPTFRGDDRILAGFVGSDFVTMTGDALAATWTTGDYQPKPGYRSTTKTLYPLVENQNANTTFSVGAREKYKGGTINWTDEVAVGTGGFAPVIKDGRYVRAKMNIPAGSVWDKAIGMQVEFEVSGRT